MKKLLILSLSLAIGFAACKKDKDEPADNNPTNPVDSNQTNNGIVEIPASMQPIGGDASIGLEYLKYGDYISSGIPYAVYNQVFGSSSSNVLNRTGDNAQISFDYTAVDAPNGVRVVGPNCFQCHAGYLNGQFILGLGNTLTDFSENQSTNVTLSNSAVQFLYGANSPEWEAYEPFSKGLGAISSNIVTDCRGVNPADKITEVLIAYRDKTTLEWNDNATQMITPEVIPTDVPAWWLLKKKNAMFYTGVGRGSFTRFLMASSLLTMIDSSKANEVDPKFIDVLAYINSIEPPAYPETIDPTLVDQGELLFNDNCASCHGTYGANESYPNLLVSKEVVGTDPVLSDAYQSTVYGNFMDWYNTGWFGTVGQYTGLAQTEGGYVAQPLDGIWATAPYFHNASVPTLEDVLNSSQRPTYWKRSFNQNDYDFQKVGWNYTVESSQSSSDTYNTTLYGYGNQGHTFGDNLTTEERSAVIEYLKTL